MPPVPDIEAVLPVATRVGDDGHESLAERCRRPQQERCKAVDLSDGAAQPAAAALHIRNFAQLRRPGPEDEAATPTRTLPPASGVRFRFGKMVHALVVEIESPSQLVPSPGPHEVRHILVLVVSAHVGHEGLRTPPGRIAAYIKLRPAALPDFRAVSSRDSEE